MIVGEERVAPDQWDAVLPAGDRPQIVVGGPGTGKTEFLVRRVARAVESGTDPASIIMLTFSRRAANDLRSRLFAAVGSASFQINVSTYHSLANRIVEADASARGDEPPTVLTGPEHEAFVLRLLRETDPSVFHESYRGIAHTPAMAAELTDFILRMREQRMTTPDLARSAVPEWAGIASFVDRYDTALIEENRIDYGTLLDRAAEISSSNTPSHYTLVLADEYQDTAPVQAAMLFSLAVESNALTVAGDPYQSIFSFRGSDLRNVLDFPEACERVLGLPADRIVLTTSFRVPPEILEAAVDMTGRELPGAAGKVQSLAGTGHVDAHVFHNLDAEVEWLASDIEKVHLTDGVPLDRIAVFSRSAGDFPRRVAAALERRSIPHGLTDEQLEDQPVVRFFDDLVAATQITDAAAIESHDLMRSLLLGPFVGATPGAVNDIAHQVDGGKSWPDAIAASPMDLQPVEALLRSRDWATGMPAIDGLWFVWDRLPRLRQIATDDELVADRRAWSAFAQAVERFGDRMPTATLVDRFEILEASDLEADALFSFRTDQNGGVTIATLHRAKGTEFDVVYIANAVEGLLPDLRSRDSILRTRLLNPQLPEDPAEYVQFRLSEERRLAYTAMTRATRRVVWTATKFDSSSEQSQPSRFLRQVSQITTPSTSGRPLTRRGYEAHLRRLLRDRDADPVERISALSVLAEAPRHGLTDQFTRYGTLAHGSDTGFVPDDHRFSPSQATIYDQCPRRYVLDRFATCKESDSPYLRIGLFVHDVLERAERAAISRGLNHATKEDALSLLEDSWEGSGFGDDRVGLAWKDRATTIVEQLYDNWPSTAEVVAVEQEVEVQLDGKTWTGKIDRIERSETGIRIVDYKTSKNAAKIADVASSIQLAFYCLAATEDQELAAMGPVEAAELWYPAALLRSGITRRSFEMTNLEDRVNRMIEVADGVLGEQFPAVVSKDCDRCDFRSVCPAQLDGQEAFLR